MQNVCLVNKKTRPIVVNLVARGITPGAEAYINWCIGAGARQTLTDGYHPLCYQGAVTCTKVEDLSPIVREPCSANIIRERPIYFSPFAPGAPSPTGLCEASGVPP